MVYWDYSYERRQCQTFNRHNSVTLLLAVYSVLANTNIGGMVRPGRTEAFLCYVMKTVRAHFNYCQVKIHAQKAQRERIGSVVECLTRDRGTAGSSLAGVTALWFLSKTHLS